MADETYRNIIEKIARTKSSSVSVFADFCRIVACCLVAGAREDEYFAAIKPYSKDELNQLSKALALLVNEMESAYFTDVLGTYYTEIASHSSKRARGEFYTPPSICKLMAMMSVDAKTAIADKEVITVLEPACGAGGMVLALAELFAPENVDLLRVTCQDINPVAVDMCYINMTMWGIPARMRLGNFLTPNTSYTEWKNIHWHRVGEDQRLAAEQMLQIIRSPIPEKEKKELKPDITLPPIEKRLGAGGQFEFDLGLDESEHITR